MRIAIRAKPIGVTHGNIVVDGHFDQIGREQGEAGHQKHEDGGDDHFAAIRPDKGQHAQDDIFIEETAVFAFLPKLADRAAWPHAGLKLKLICTTTS